MSVALKLARTEGAAAAAAPTAAVVGWQQWRQRWQQEGRTGGTALLTHCWLLTWRGGNARRRANALRPGLGPARTDTDVLLPVLAVSDSHLRLPESAEPVDSAARAEERGGWGRRTELNPTPRSRLCCALDNPAARTCKPRPPISRDTSAWALAQPPALASRFFSDCSIVGHSPTASRRSQPPPVHSSPNPSPVPPVCSRPDATDLLSAYLLVAGMRQNATERRTWPPVGARPLVAAAVLLLVALAPAACAATAPAAAQQLPDVLLHKLLYEEPNAQLQMLGNVRRPLSLLHVPASWPRCSTGLSAWRLSLSSMPGSMPQISDHEGSLSRVFLSPAHRRAADQVRPLLPPAVACGSTALILQT